MPQISQLKLSLRLFLTAYRWRRVDPVPATRLSKPLTAARVALVTSAGLVAPGDTPFDPSIKGGDWSYRILPADVEVPTLEEHHKSDAFDHSGIEADRNMGLPLEALRALAAAGEIGSVAPRHISLMGSITAPGRLLRHTVPRVVEILKEDQVDIALLVPV
jgi:hypothetical protein